MTRLYWHLLCGACLAFGGLAGALLVARFGFYSDVMILIFLSGAIGAVVNNYYRVAKLTETAKPAEVMEGNRAGLVIIQMYVSMFIGGILAFVAYGLFASGLIQGSLFPVFERTQDSYESVTSMLLRLGPKANIDAAKSVLWAFIAGFSERFVPNIIDALIAKASIK